MAADGTTTDGRVLRWARTYDLVASVCTLGRERRFRERLVDLAELAPGEAALDVGCGTGTLAIAAARRVGGGGQVWGVDLSPPMVARARRKAAKSGVAARFETASVEALPFPDGTFDAVLGTLMLHHLTDEGLRSGVSEVARVLKPGGRFFAVDIGDGATGWRKHLHLRRRRHAHFDLAELTPMLDAAGLHVASQGPVGPPRLIGLSNLRFILAVAPPR